MTRIGSAQIVIEGDAGKFKKDAAKAGSEGTTAISRGLSPLTERVRSISSRAGNAMKTTLKNAGKAAGLAVIATVGAALTKGFSRLTGLENAQAKMRGLGHDTKTVERIMDGALKSVEGTAFGLDEAANAAARAVAAGIKPGNDLDRTLKIVADSAAAAGTNMDEMSGIFAKAATSGKAGNDVLGQLADRGIDIYGKLAEQLNLTKGEVAALASEGKISFKQFEDAAEVASGNVAAEMGKTLTGSIRNAWASLGRSGANVLLGIFDKLAPAVQSVTGWMKNNLEPAAKRVGEAIGSLVDRAIDGFQGLKSLLVDGDFTSAFRKAFGVEEDSAVVSGLLRIREIAMGIFNLFKGQGTGMLAKALGVSQDHWIITFLRTIRELVIAAFSWIRDQAIPAVRNFFGEFRRGEGAGGKFRDVIVAIGKAANVTFQWIIDNVLPALKALASFIVNTLWPDVKRAFLDRIWPAMVEVGKVIKRQWEMVIQPALSAMWRFIRDVLGPFLVEFYEEGVKPTFDLIGKVISWTWENIIKPAWTNMQDRISILITRFVNAKRDITNAWTAIKDGISRGWDGIKSIFTKFKNGLTDLRNWFTRIRDGIRDTWRSLSNAIARPINSVIDKVNAFLSNVKAGLNKIPGVNLTGNWSIRKIILDTANATVGGGPNQALAGGGKVQGSSPSWTADNILARLTAGEFVLPVRAVRRLLSTVGHGGLEALRQGALPFSRGGRVGDAGTPDDQSWLAGLWSNATDWVKKFFRKLIPDSFGDSWAGQAILGAVKSINLDGLKDWILGKAQGAYGGKVNYPGGFGWNPRGMMFPQIISKIMSVVPNAIISSTFRPGAITANGIRSLHSLGRAVDWYTPGMRGMVDAFRRVGALMPWSQHFYTPAGRNLQQGIITPQIQRDHVDHAHTAMALGGMVEKLTAAFRRPFVADSGAVLGRGLNVLDNRTGGPETLRRDGTTIMVENIEVKIALEDLESIKTLEDFLKMITVRAGMLRPS